MTISSCCLIAAFVSAMTQQQVSRPVAETPHDQKPASAVMNPDDLPVSFDRIQKAISQPPAIRLEGDRPVFRTEIIGQKPTIEEILGPDFYKGAVAYGGVTHQEFLNMVTPKDVQGYAAFTNREALAIAATSFALQWALQRAIQRLENARGEREREAARREVQEALAELARARQKAGLPPK